MELLAVLRQSGQNSIQLDVVHDSDRVTLAVLYDFGTDYEMVAFVW